MLHAGKESEITARMMIRIGEFFIELSFVDCLSGRELEHPTWIKGRRVENPPGIPGELPNNQGSL
jgi:hypothetical protein